jgi:imidazolonepropionase-like amidohydrolase
MRRRFILFLLLVISASAALAQNSSPAKSAGKKLAIVGATVVNLDGKAAIKDSAVLIEGSRIVAVGTRQKVKVPADAEVIDARGKFILPGLIDAHTHSNFDGKTSWLLPRFLAHGITTVLDTGSTATVYELKRRTNSGELSGPRMLVSGALLTAPPVQWPFSEAVNTADEARRAVDERAARGAEFVKVYAQLPIESLRAAIDEAHKKSMRAIGHLGRTNALEATRAGINIITHLMGVPDCAVPDPEKVRAAHASGFIPGWLASTLAWQQADESKLNQLIREMVARNVALVPTLNVHQGVAFIRDPLPYRQEAIATRPPEATLKEWEALAALPIDTAPFKKSWPMMQQFVRRFYEAGGMLVVGTDTAAAYQPPGLSAHEEMRLMVEAGVPAVAALRAATINAARALGIEREVGAVEAGKRADIVIVDDDPLASITNTRKIFRVIKAGAVYNP